MPKRDRPRLRVIQGTAPQSLRPRAATRPQPAVESTGRTADATGVTQLEFAVLRFAATLALGVLALSLAVLTRMEPQLGVALVLAAVLAGALAPTLVASAQGRARRRRVRRALPMALDLLAIFIAAGLSLESALRRLAELRNDAFAEELRCVLAERKFESGVASLRELGRRTGLGEITALADRLSSTDRFGARAADVVRDELARLRTAGRQISRDANG